jgi:hypothetical protein
LQSSVGGDELRYGSLGLTRFCFPRVALHAKMLQILDMVLLLLLMLLLLRLLQRHQSLLFYKMQLYLSQPPLYKLQLSLQSLISLPHHRLPRCRLLLLQLRNSNLVPQPRSSISFAITSQPLLSQPKGEPGDL